MTEQQPEIQTDPRPDSRRPRVWVLYERSGVVRRACAAVGCDARSVDLQPSPDGSPAHVQVDVRALIDAWLADYLRGVPIPADLVIAHPPCTYLTNSAAWAFGDGPYHQRIKPGTLVGAARREARERALQDVRRLFDLAAAGVRVCVENPVGAISTAIRPASQYVQPYQFGDDASKTTGLWLEGLPPLQPTRHVAPRVVNGRPRWANQTDSGQNKLGPRPGRADARAETYPGIAAAMAAQWGRLLV